MYIFDSRNKGHVNIKGFTVFCVVVHLQVCAFVVLYLVSSEIGFSFFSLDFNETKDDEVAVALAAAYVNHRHLAPDR